jgi:hypothetical protein
MAAGGVRPATAHPPPRPRMSVHLTVAAALHVALGAMGVLGGVMLVLSGRAAETGVLTDLLGVLLAAAALAGVVGGIGLFRGAVWARILVLAVSVVYLFDLPFGTALGAYSIWVLLHPGILQALAARRHA